MAQSALTTGTRRRGKTRVRTFVPWWMQVLNFFGIFITFILLGTIGAIAYGLHFFWTVTREMPTPDSIVDYTPGGVTEIYATDKDPKTGKNILLGRVYEQYKTFVPIEKIPKRLQDATISIEDERFRTHTGIDPIGIARAAYSVVRTRNLSQGASTLTQQLVRSVYLPQKGGANRAKTPKRKIQEMLLSIQLERSYTKDQILEMYLNEVYYGSNAYGVHAAAEVYFGKKLEKLNLAETALIVGIPQRPSSLSPFVSVKAAVARRNLVLDKMAELGYVTKAEAEKAKKEVPKLAKAQPHIRIEFKAPYFTNYVLRQLLEKFGRAKVFTGGLKVYTTLNWQMQQEGERALLNGIQSAKYDGVNDGALVCLEPRTGYIRTMVGGTDFKKYQYNNVTQGHRQPGSSFKAVVYTAALDSGRFGNQYSSVDNSRRSYHGYRPSGGGPGGYVSMRTAVTYSYNNAAVWTANQIGPRRVIEYARRMGVKSELKPTLAIALGSYEVTPLEMASIYTTFANYGSHAEPMSIVRVMDQDGALIWDNKPKVERAVIPESVVANMSDMFAAVVAQGTASKANGIHEIANAHGKTGTTNDNRDAWFVGYTPELTTAVWVCSAQRKIKNGRIINTRYVPMSSSSTGGLVCAPIWARFMKASVPIQKKSKMEMLPPPEKVIPPVIVLSNKKPKAGEVLEKAQPVKGSPVEVIKVDAGETDAGTETKATDSPATDTPDKRTKPEGNDGVTTAPENGNEGEPVAKGVGLQEDPAATKPAPPPVRPTVVATPKVERSVTVRICVDSGKRATIYCPGTIIRSFAAREVPRGTCRIHRPQPGEGD